MCGDDFTLINGGGDDIHSTEGSKDGEGWFSGDHLMGAEFVTLLVGDAVSGVSYVSNELELIFGGQDVV